MMLLLLAAVLGVLAVRGSAQYDYSRALGNGFTLRYSRITEEEYWVEVEGSGPSEWIGFGLSESNSMPGSDVLVACKGCESELSVALYKTNNTSGINRKQAAMGGDNPGITSYRLGWDSENGVTLSFNATNVYGSSLANSKYFVVAAGMLYNDQPDQHTKRAHGANMLGDAVIGGETPTAGPTQSPVSGETPTAGPTQSPVSGETPTPGPTQSPVSAATDAPSESPTGSSTESPTPAEPTVSPDELQNTVDYSNFKLAFNRLESGAFDIEVSAERTGLEWIAIGLSESSSMPDTELLLACAGCELAGENDVGFAFYSTDGNSNITGVNTDLVGLSKWEAAFKQGPTDGSASLRFQGSQINGKSIADAAYVIMAAGSLAGGKPTDHGSPRDSTNRGANPFPPGDDSPTPSPSVAPQGDDSPTSSPTEAPDESNTKFSVLGQDGDAAEVTIELLTEEESGERRALQSTRARITVTAALEDGEKGWLAVGLNPNGRFTMVNAQTVIGMDSSAPGNEFANGNDVAVYELQGKVGSGAEVAQPANGELEEESFSIADNKMTLSFVASAIGTEAFAIDGSNNLIFSMGKSATGALQQHPDTSVGGAAVREIEWLSLAPPGSTDPIDNTSKILAHGWIMVISFVWLFPVSALPSVFRSKFPGESWFVVHRGMQVSTVLLVIIAFIIIMVTLGPSFDNPHSILGLVLFILVLIQPLAAFCLRKGDKRQSWRASHFFVGYFLILAGLINCYLGVSLAQGKPGSQGLRSFLITGNVLSCVCMGILGQKRVREGMREAGPAHEAVEGNEQGASGGVEMSEAAGTSATEGGTQAKSMTEA